MKKDKALELQVFQQTPAKKEAEIKPEKQSVEMVIRENTVKQLSSRVIQQETTEEKEN